jgi:hypothetical protein
MTSCAHTPTHIPSSTSHTCQKGWGWEKMQPHCSFQHANQIPTTTALALTAPATPSPPMRRQAHSSSGLHFFTRDAKMHVLQDRVWVWTGLGPLRVSTTVTLLASDQTRARGAHPTPLALAVASTDKHTHSPCFAAKVSRGVQDCMSSATPFLHTTGKKGVLVNVWVSTGAGRDLGLQAKLSTRDSVHLMR